MGKHEKELSKPLDAALASKSLGEDVVADVSAGGKSEYTGEDIQVLKGLEGVRVRPAMYIGSTAEAGLHHLVWEIVDNAIDEVMAGYATKVVVELHDDGSVSVEDDGRGIPVDFMADEGKPALEVILSTLHAGGKFGGEAYKVSGGLHGVGSSVVNALSLKFHADVHRDGQIHHIEFERGVTTMPMTVTGKTKKRGTVIRFWPDPEIFETVDFKASTLEGRLRELAFLNAGIEITLLNDAAEDEEDKRQVYKYKGGLSEFVKWMCRSQTSITPVVHFIKQIEDTRVEIAMQWTDGYQERINGYANNIFTKDGGTHVVGLKAALTRVVNQYASKRDLVKGKEQVTGDDIREGLVAICSVWLREPQFEGQTKSQLGNSEVKGLVEAALGEALSTYLDENPGVGKKLVDRAAAAARAREAAKRARDIERKKSGLSSGLPGKLTDCSEKNPELCELFIVEGDSAAGPAKQGRNRATQAILPIRGKILNVEKANMLRVLQNEEVRAMISAIGTGFGHDFNYDKLRYHKVVIMTDADVDGAHIRTLLLTFFFNFMPQLIENGHLYIALNPLYRLRKGKGKPVYVFTEKEREDKTKELGGNVDVTRFKGLGEMNPDELSETTLNIESRTLLRVNIEDIEEVRRVVDRLMGDEVAPRKRFITEYARKVKNLDI